MSKLDSHRGFIGEHDLYRGRIEPKHDYPPVLFETIAAGKGVIRLHVAAIIVCLDHAPQTPVYDERMERELESFLSGESAEPDTDDDGAWSIYPHEYMNREIDGTLRPLYLQLINALVASIQSGQLKPLFARQNLAGKIDPLRTWIETDHLLEWCDERDLYLDVCLDEYVSGERKIEEAIFAIGGIGR